MAGLVDYVVDSGKDSDDEEHGTFKVRESKRTTKDKQKRSSPAIKSSTSPRESSDLVKNKSREVPETSSSSSKEARNRDREHRQKHKKRSRSRDREERKHDRSKDRVKDSQHRKRSRSRSKERKSQKHNDDRMRHKSRSKSRSKSPSRDKHHKSNRRERTKEERSDVTKAEQPKITLPSEQPEQSRQQSTSVPSFYNPNAVNQSKIAQQMQKRKLLWSNKEKETTTAKLWESTAFNQDQDGKMTAKFKRLMGIKGDGASAPAEPTDVLNKQKELFASLDQQYAVARATTHTQRGLGLGFSSNPR